jgi:methylase of polypeptide subunit release factors
VRSCLRCTIERIYILGVAKCSHSKIGDLTVPPASQTTLDPASPVLRQLREILESAGYFQADIAPTIDNRDVSLPGADAQSTPLNTLLRLFFMAEDCPLDAVAAAIPPLSTEQLSRAGILSVAGDWVSSCFRLQPYEKMLFAFTRLTPETPPEETLMLVSPSSLEVAHLMMRRGVRRALDIGTGSGFLASLISLWSESVVAIDINTAAIRMAEFNARWNGISNVTFLNGNLLEPVREQRFDLIVCNPPFFICPVITPFSSRYAFKHSGSDGDDFCINLARAASQLLTEDGYFHMIFQWEEPAAGAWSANLEKALSGLGCDAWLARIMSESSDEYTKEWISTLTEEEQTDATATGEQAREYFRAKNIGSLGTGLLTLRRASARQNYLWFDEAPEDRLQPYGDSVRALFDARTRMMQDGGPGLVQAKLRASPHITMLQTLAVRDGEWSPTSTELNLDQGLKYSFGDVDARLTKLLTYFDGRRTVKEACDVFKKENPEVVANPCAFYLATIRELLWYGFLEFAEHG